MSSQLPPVANPYLISGPPVIGISLNWWLYGILLMQYFIYVNKASKMDGKLLQGVVHFLFLFETAQTMMTMGDFFFWFVQNFGDLSKLFEFHLGAFDGPFMDAVIAVTVQFVYCWRLWKIGQWKVVPIGAALLAATSCIGGMIAGIHSTIDPTNHDKPALYIWLLATAVTDIVLAGSMVYLVYNILLPTSENSWINLVPKAHEVQSKPCEPEHYIGHYKADPLINAGNQCSHRCGGDHACHLLPGPGSRASCKIFYLEYVTSKNNFMHYPFTEDELIYGPGIYTWEIVCASITTFVNCTVNDYHNIYRYSNSFMVLLNQRVYYEAPGGVKDNETFSSSSHRSRGISSRNQEFGISSQNQAAGQISVIRFVETRSDEPMALEMGNIHGTKDDQDLKPVPRTYV